jgi:hypothetical protein
MDQGKEAGVLNSWVRGASLGNNRQFKRHTFFVAGRAITTKRGNFAADLLQVQQSVIVYTNYNCRLAGQGTRRWPLDSGWQNAAYLSYPPSMPLRGRLRAAARI